MPRYASFVTMHSGAYFNSFYRRFLILSAITNRTLQSFPPEHCLRREEITLYIY